MRIGRCCFSYSHILKRAKSKKQNTFTKKSARVTTSKQLANKIWWFTSTGWEKYFSHQSTLIRAQFFSLNVFGNYWLNFFFALTIHCLSLSINPLYGSVCGSQIFSLPGNFSKFHSDCVWTRKLAVTYNNSFDFFLFLFA